jgi:uncharacterized lipoprotein YmbA
MKKFTLYVGLNDKDTKTQLISTLEAYKVINNVLLQYVDGATIFEARGIYKHDDGTFTTENTFRIELLFVETETVKEIVKVLKAMLNQESIAVQHEIVESELW